MRNQPRFTIQVKKGELSKRGNWGELVFLNSPSAKADKHKL